MFLGRSPRWRKALRQLLHLRLLRPAHGRSRSASNGPNSLAGAATFFFSISDGDDEHAGSHLARRDRRYLVLEAARRSTGWIHAVPSCALGRRNAIVGSDLPAAVDVPWRLGAYRRVGPRCRLRSKASSGSPIEVSSSLMILFTTGDARCAPQSSTLGKPYSISFSSAVFRRPPGDRRWSSCDCCFCSCSVGLFGARRAAMTVTVGHGGLSDAGARAGYENNVCLRESLAAGGLGRDPSPPCSAPLLFLIAEPPRKFRGSPPPDGGDSELPLTTCPGCS